MYISKRRSSLPDLAVAFNAGISESPSSWTPTIASLVEDRIPTVCTAFNQMEAQSDASAVQKMGGGQVRFVWKEEKNIWASGRKHFDLFSVPDLFWSENLYWTGFLGRD
ncbi:hypothetical protein BDY24DRAFT_377876 [Mrakia frigida]|uniref:uncharacterized protein n=1 Tax=Mrakia frigida TaxID=29902 RepID=UPI003FCBF9AB